MPASASLALLTALSAAFAGPAWSMEWQAALADQDLCQSAILRIERKTGLPDRLLGAIGLVESGRADPVSGRVSPWPWSLNIAGIDHVYATKAEAMAGVSAAQARGVRSIDVGCMQVNLLFHPDAFATLDEALDPASNVTYAAGFLHRLREDVGSWPAAAAAYHSVTPVFANAYAERVARYWPPARGYVAPGTPPPTAAALPRIDPRGVMTPELLARARNAASDHAALLAARARPVPALTRLASAVAPQTSR